MLGKKKKTFLRTTKTLEQFLLKKEKEKRTLEQSEHLWEILGFLSLGTRLVCLGLLRLAISSSFASPFFS